MFFACVKNVFNFVCLYIFITEGTATIESTAIIAITANNSINVNPCCLLSSSFCPPPS